MTRTKTRRTSVADEKSSIERLMDRTERLVQQLREKVESMKILHDRLERATAEAHKARKELETLQKKAERHASVDDLSVELAFLAKCYKEGKSLMLAPGHILPAPTNKTIVSRIRSILTTSDRLLVLDASKLGAGVN
jgi:predicted RNase H-like nuclease (RuvC/YqgF family)